MRHIILFLILSAVFNPKKLLSQSNEMDSLIQLAIKFAEKKQNDSLDFTLSIIVPKVVGNELDSLLKKRQKSRRNLIEGANVIYAKSQMQSLLLLLICLTAFVYLIYYTDKKNRERQNKKIQAASGISEYEANLRKRISEKLHDDLGGSIAALKMKWVGKKELSDDVKILDDLYQDVRKFSKDLNFQNKFHLKSIEEAINILSDEMCANFRKKTINIFPKEINNIKNKNLIDDVVMTTKELITNVIKHSQADEIAVDVSLVENKIVIIVQDNGIGFNFEKNEGQGMGSIRNRAIMREGIVDIDSNKKGTSVTVELKIKNDKI